MRALRGWVAAGALLLAACSGGGGGGEGTTLNLSADDTAFDTTELSADAGTITINFQNDDDGVTHNLRVSGNGLDESTELEEGPVEQTLTFDAEPGSYEFICTVHPNEMVGTLEVS